MRFVIASGGTGGHISPGLAIAAALREIDPQAEILFLGGGGLASHLIPREGWLFRRVATAQVAGRSWRAIFALPSIGAGTLQSIAILRHARPDAVVVTGAYASAPVGAAAVVLRVPLVLQEQNLVPGITNRLLARWAQKISIPDEAAAVHFPRRAVVTGVPVRAQAMGGDRRRGLARFSLEATRRTVVVLGGSQGARSLNAAMVEAAPRLAAAGRLQILHQAGADHVAWVRARAAEITAPRYVAEGYIEDVADAYACADVVVCRAGAATIAEVTANGLPLVAVPYPHAAGGHQEVYARLLGQLGAAVVVLDRELSGAYLADVLNQLLAAPGRLQAMAEASRRIGRPRAAAQVAELIVQVVSQRAHRD